MNRPVKPLILVVDDDQDFLRITERLLTKSNYDVITADSALKGLEVLKKAKPDIILLDVVMPDMGGYEFCTKLQANAETAYIPVIFVTALGEEKNKARAFSVGAVDHFVKPSKKEILIEKIKLHLKINVQWEKLRKDTFKSAVSIGTSDFIEFKEFLSNQLNLSPDKKQRLAATPHTKIYSISSEIGINTRQMAQYIANFMKLPYTSYIDPEAVDLCTIPPPFSRLNLVLVVKGENAAHSFVVSNPFDLELIGTLDKLNHPSKLLILVVTQPESIEAILKSGVIDESVKSPIDITISKDKDKISKIDEQEITAEFSPAEIEKYPVVYIANNILYAAVSERASDIHIEPKKTNFIIRFRIDGDMRDMFTLKRKTGAMLISRFMVIGGLDITDKRKPQDGTFEATIDNRNFKLRLASTSTPDGASLIIRLLEPYAKSRTLSELGMTDEQVNIMINFTNRNQGLILLVGPTGSGKTTTAYSLLSQIDCKVRSLISVEDPVEYRIPFANQQQVNEPAGVTFEAVLKSVVRQDPDIMFLGEIRDQYSARVVMDFASTGHLTLGTLHTANTTTAIFRLERLGISRGIMSDVILCVVAQRLLKKLCPHCKKIVPITHEEIDMLSSFTDEIPNHVAHPVGCPRCNNTGYYGREGIYEILNFDPEIAKIVRSTAPISEIRDFTKKKAGYLISNHPIEKVKNLFFPPADVYRNVLVEETKLIKEISEKKKQDVTIDEEEIGKKKSILVVDDDKDIQSILKVLLENHDYEVTTVQDGVDAIINLSERKYDLIISDINMPNLDGFKLIDIMNQKGIQTPVVFLTANTKMEDEARGFELGAVDYIKKPIQKEILLARIKRLLENTNLVQKGSSKK